MIYICSDAQSCQTLCNLLDGSQPGLSVHGILQARILEGVATLSSRSSQCRDQYCITCIPCFGRWSLYHQCHLKVKVIQSCPTFCDPMFNSPCNSPGQNTGMGSCSVLQEIFATQGSNAGLLHCGQILHHLSYQGLPVPPGKPEIHLQSSSLFASTEAYLRAIQKRPQDSKL